MKKKGNIENYIIKKIIFSLQIAYCLSSFILLDFYNADFSDECTFQALSMLWIRGLQFFLGDNIFQPSVFK